MLPHSLVTVSLVTALFTRMSRCGARGANLREVADDVRPGLRMPAVVARPRPFGGMLLGVYGHRDAATSSTAPRPRAASRTS